MNTPIRKPHFRGDGFVATVVGGRNQPTRKLVRRARDWPVLKSLAGLKATIAEMAIGISTHIVSQVSHRRIS
jgi:hypothetical protein